MGEELKKLNNHIAEIYAMIGHFIQLKERGVDFAVEELHYWRKMLQDAKIQKRRLQST